jgi:hypothetical protein
MSLPLRFRSVSSFQFTTMLLGFTAPYVRGVMEFGTLKEVQVVVAKVFE